MRRTRLLAVAVTLSLAAGAGVATAQPTLVSTCGPISASGSYKLANNLSAAGDCLVLTGAANTNTTIDLDGFTITGNGTGAGVSNDDVVEGLTVRNGTIKGFERGIGVFGNNITVDRMSLLRNSAFGLTGVENVLIKDSLLNGNGVAAAIGEGAVVTGSTFSFNTSDGLQVNAAGVSPGSTISNNIAIRNGGAGYRVTCPGLILGNTANGNAGGNFVLVGAGCTSAHTVP
jgi:hypothetical protein